MEPIPNTTPQADMAAYEQPPQIQNQQNVTSTEQLLDKEARVNSVTSIKLPRPFWKDSPARWFAVAEAAFGLHRVTSDTTKFRHILINLDSGMLGVIGDLIDSPPQTGKYEALKNRIVTAFGESSETRLRRLLRGQSMGNEKPSLYLQRMRNLAGGQCNVSILRTLFMEQLPEQTRGILAMNDTEDLSALALQADRIAEVMLPRIEAVNTRTTQNRELANGLERTSRRQSMDETIAGAETSSSKMELSELRASIEALSREVKNLRERSRSRQRTRQGRDRSKSPWHNTQGKDNTCFYHERFGDKARKCRKPCDWGNNSGN